MVLPAPLTTLPAMVRLPITIICTARRLAESLFPLRAPVAIQVVITEALVSARTSICHRDVSQCWEMNMPRLLTIHRHSAICRRVCSSDYRTGTGGLEFVGRGWHVAGSTAGCTFSGQTLVEFALVVV